MNYSLSVLLLRTRITTMLVLGLCISSNTGLLAGDFSGGDLVPTLITFRDAPGASEQALISSLGGRIKYTYDIVPTIAAWLPEQATTALTLNPGVLRVEPDVAVHTLDAELDASWGAKHIGAGVAHASGNRGAGIKVGIIDTGIDYTHPELAGNYAGGWDFVNDDADPLDDHSLRHGTKVAGIVGAADDGIGIVGVAPEADLYAYKVFDSSGVGNYSDVIAALGRAVTDGIDVLNISLGSAEDPGVAFEAAVNHAAGAGLVLIAAAGNDGSSAIAYPAHYESVIAVGATMNETDTPAFFSNTGEELDLMAPGYNILTTDFLGTYSLEFGTSFAAPHVAGAAALFLSKGVDDVRGALISTAIDLWTPGFDTLTGYGLVNVAGAALPVIPAPPALGLALLGAVLVRRNRRFGV